MKITKYEKKIKVQSSNEKLRNCLKRLFVADVEDIGEFQKNLNHEGNTREGQTKSQNKLMNLLRPGKGFCGAGRRFHALACSEDGGRTNVSASVCGSEGNQLQMMFLKYFHFYP